MLAALLAFTFSLPFSVQVGDKAPALTPDKWVGDAPDLAGKPVLVEFWGTWCGPCVATMPHVQELAARYREQGLVVVAISYEAPDVISGFASKHGLTMAMASDPEKKLVDAFGIDSWPTTFVIGKDGKVLYRGWPMMADAFVQEALGLETSEATLLSRYVKGEGEAKTVLESLVANAGREFDLGSWARGRGGAAATRPPKDPGVSLSSVAAAAGAPASDAQLGDLAALTTPFDLKSWAEHELGARFPLGDAEVKTLLDAERFADVVHALVSRNPTDKALAAAKGDDGMRDWCHERVEAAAAEARFVVLLGHWAFGEYKRPDTIEFPPGAAVVTEKDNHGLEGVHFASGLLVMKSDFPGCIETVLAETCAVQALAKRKLPGDLKKAAAKLHADLLGELKKKYGTDKAPAPKAD
jgi:thiol-disulfide isomerase/thioredoxin